MMNSLQMTTSLKDNKWVLDFEVLPGADFPRDIFVFENKGIEGLGEYQTVSSLSDYRSYQTYSVGLNIPIFGNKYVKFLKGSLTFSVDKNPETYIRKITKDVQAFRVAYMSGVSSTQIIPL